MMFRSWRYATLPLRFWAALALAVLSAVALLTPSPTWADREITIHETWVNPPAVTVTVAEGVSFVNRTGQMVHLEFQDDPGRHMVVQVPGASPIRVTFLRTGSHPYAVHFPAATRPALQGKVDVLPDPRGSSDPSSCVEQVIPGVCLER